MIDITVRTLNSQNYDFSVEENLSVLQFKEHIAGTINVPADVQRIIFCGRVLADDAKLLDLDLHRKVVHLVERPPPNDNAAANATATNETGTHPMDGAAPLQGRIPTFTMGGNAMYVGSMAIPFEPNNFAPPPPSARLAASRLAVARRMLSRIADILTQLENPTNARLAARRNRPVVVEDVPITGISLSSFLAGGASADSSPTSTSTDDLSAAHESDSAAAAQEETAPSDSQAQGAQETANGQETPAQEANNNMSRTAEMAELLDQLTSLQQRFAPFLERYRNFMHDDPTMDRQETRAFDRTMYQVSEVLHYLGHAYHSLSDIHVRARSPPPRRLVCWPILIQQTSVMPAGFPIQVEAQINIGPEQMPSAANVSAAQTQTSQTATNPPPSNANNANTNNTNRLPTFEHTLLNLPGLPPRAVHVHSIPMGIRARPSAANRPNAPSDTPQDPNVELIMELTPEGYSVNAMEGGQRQEGRNRANNSAIPHEFIHSIMQMASQLISRTNATVPGVQTTFATSEMTTSTSTTSGQAQANGNSGQNSQARGNTQTNPTTATHTRSTPRPHVHFSHHTIQGFDPFLPCNSHHILNLRRGRGRGQSQQTEANAAAPTTPPNNSTEGRASAVPVPAVMQDLVDNVLMSLQTMYGADRQQVSTNAASADVAPDAEGVNEGSVEALSESRRQAPSTCTPATFPNLSQIQFILRHMSEAEQGRGLLSDLSIFLGRHFLTTNNLPSNGRIDPWLQMRNEIRNFTCDVVLEGNPATQANVLRAVTNVLSELRPFINVLRELPIRHGIDIIRSVELLIRMRLPFVINTAASRRPTAIRSMVNQLIVLYQHFCALVMHACEDGSQAIVDLFANISDVYLEGLPECVLEWGRQNIREHVRASLDTINMSAELLQPYIIRVLDNDEEEGTSELFDWQASDDEGREHPADAAADAATADECILGEVDAEDGEESSPMEISAEQWHEDVPADWVPIITRDAQRQRRQSQAPLSEAYLSGMPNKRRKVVKNSKPTGSIQQVISDGIRRAVNTSGLGNVTNVETVSQAAAADMNIQSAYRDLLRTNVQSTLQDNADFAPERFPNTTAFFRKTQ